MVYNVEFKNEVVQAKEKGEDLKKFIDNGKPTKKTIDDWYKLYLLNGLFTEESNNDAIPSWSGYNYQGKIMILITLQLINKLLIEKSENIGNWSVELEKLQDFAFKENKIVQSLWQVKATLSKSRVTLYNEALEKLIKDKDLSNNKNAECYLISAKNIDDWDNDDNNFKDYVNLYKYKDASVYLSKVAEYAKYEVKELLENLNFEDQEEDIYLIICEFIEEKVFEYHQKGKRSNYEIKFEEIINVVKNANFKKENLFKFNLKENLFKYITDLIERDTKEFCDDCDQSGKCNLDCGSIKNYELSKDVKIDEYIGYLNPEVEKENILGYAMKDYVYADNVCSVFKESEVGAIECLNNMIYLNYNKGKIKIVPTLLSINSNKESRISKTLEKINNNEIFNSKMKNIVLSGAIDGRVFQTQLDKFTYIKIDDLLENDHIKENKEIGIREKLSDKNLHDNKINFSENITVIDKNELINCLKELG